MGPAFGGQAVGCPGQRVVNFLFQVGDDFGGEGFTEFQFFEVVVGVHRGIYGAGIWRRGRRSEDHIGSQDALQRRYGGRGEVWEGGVVFGP